jgi:hypothetical protein
MRDAEFVNALNDLDLQGKDGLPAMRDLLKSEGGMSRVISIAIKGLEPKPRKPRAPRSTEEPEGFDEWYTAYPRHVARSSAAAAYRRALARVSAETLLAAALRYKKDCTDPEFTKHPATWLNGGCWADEPMGLALVYDGEPFADATRDGWLTRLEIFYGFTSEPKGTWLKKWGPRPDETGNKIDPDAMAAFRRIHPTVAIAAAAM